MTDKQIIIDGVDVSGCDFLAKEDDYCSYSGVTYAYKGQCGCSDEEMCKDHPNCFYKKVLKQLKRSEAQCEGMFVSHTDLEKNYKAKEQECERLKEALKEKTDEYNNLAINYDAFVSMANKQLEQLKAEVKSKTEYIQEQREIIDKYKQTLTEIKEVLQFYNNTTIGIDKGNGFFEFEVYNDNVLGGKLICHYDTNPAKKALQKISECEVENE